MSESNPIEPESIKKADPATEDDVEGHRKAIASATEDDVELNIKKADPATEDDVEGHRKVIP